MNKSKRYKRYLEPDADESIPSSSKYRHLKQQSIKQPEHLTDIVQENDNNSFTMESSVKDEDVVPDNSDFVDPKLPNREMEELLLETLDTDYEISENQVFISKEDSTENMQKIFEVVESLSEDIEELELKNEEDKYVKIENEDDDFFMDPENEDADEKLLDEEKEDDNVKNKFKTLEDGMESGAFKKKIEVPVNKTVGEIIIMILRFAIIHALSLTEITDLFMMINCIFAESILPNTRYLLDKLFYPKNCMKMYANCAKCGVLLGGFEKKDRFIKCKNCKAKFKVTDYTNNKDFFVIMDVASPISKLISTNYEYYNYVVNERIHKTGVIRDIYDGEKYRKFIKSLNEADRHNYVTVTFNSDGAPLFKSSAYSIWPIFLMVNELPIHVRSKELILAGLWFGKDKPKMNTFLEPFVDQMNNLSTNGTDCIVNDKTIRIKIYSLICSVDAVARAPMQGFTQFNGSFGCGQCLHPGQWVRNNPNNKRSGSLKYPLLNEVINERTMEDTISNMRKAVKEGKPVDGVKGPSQLINLLNFNIIDGCVRESLHCCSGVAKQFATLWFGTKKKVGLLPRKIISEIDKVMESIKVPNQVVRLTRPLSEKDFWKAREWENWTMFYSLIILQNILPTNLLIHWSLFVEAIYLLTKDEIHYSEINLANKLLHKFVAQTQILYSKKAMTFNVHSLLHMSKNVLDWGPLWCHNAYAFESGNGDLLKMIHAARGVHHQICRHISIKYTYSTLKDYVFPFASFPVKNFCTTIGKTIAKNSCRTHNVRYFGSSSVVNSLWLQKLNLPERTELYNKIVKDGCLYMSSSRNNKRSNNSYAQLSNGSFVKMHNFIVHFEHEIEYTVVQKIETKNVFENSCSMIKQIIKIDNEQTVVPTNNIKKVCVHISSDDVEYLCAVPNLIYY